MGLKKFCYSMMAPESNDEAIAVMNRLMKHPITLAIQKPVRSSDLDEEGARETLTLFEITRRLHRNHYPSLFAWITDVETSIHGYESRGESAPEIAAAQEVRRRFAKERSKMHLKSSSHWSLLVGKLRLRLSQLDSAAPGRTGSQAPAQPPSPKSPASKLTSHDIHCFMNAVEVLATPEEREGILEIVCEMQPQAVLSDAQSMNCQILNEATLLRLRDYIGRCLTRRGLAWPQ
jgi:hypothetical protein